MEVLLQDLRYALRSFRRDFPFVAVVVAATALGVGANTALFSVVNAVLIRPLPFAEPDRLAVLWETSSDNGSPMGFAPPNLNEVTARSGAFDGIGAAFWKDFNLTGTGEPEHLHGAVVTANYLDVLGVRPALGRVFLPDEERFGAHRVAALSRGLFERRFGGDSAVLGRPVTLNGETYEVVAILPERFEIPVIGQADIVAPLSFAPDDAMNTRNNHYLRPVARLRPGVTPEQARAELTSVMSGLEKEFPENAGVGAGLLPLREALVGDLKPALLVLLGAVFFVLLIACADVANLLLARTSSRAREVAVRMAMGAGRGRVVRQWLTESLLLGLIGGSLGLLLAVWGQSVLSRLGAGSIPRLEEATLDGRVLLFTLAISLLSGVLFGLVPALHAVRSPLEPSLREGGRGAAGDRRGRAIRSGLIVAEVALALILLVGAGLMVRSFVSLRNVDPGFDPAGVLTMYLAPPDSRYGKVPATTALYDRILEGARATSDVTAAGATSRLPFSGGSWGKYLTVEGRPARDLRNVAQVRYEIVTPGYFRALGIHLVRGREFTAADDAKAQAAAVINAAAARDLFPGEDPIGRRVRLAPPDTLIKDTLPEGVVIPWMTIVGIAGDVRSGSLRNPAAPLVYAPLAQNADNPVPMYLAVRTAGDPLSLAAAIKSRIWAVDRDLPVSAVAPMSVVLADSISRPRFSLFLLALFAVVALALSALGIYGVTAFAVSQRTREIGVRMALGARSSDVLSMVLREEMKLALAGVTIGVAGSLVLTRLMSSLLFGVTPTDPLTFAAVAALVLLAGIASSLGPARRAASVDPAFALRWE